VANAVTLPLRNDCPVALNTEDQSIERDELRPSQDAMLTTGTTTPGMTTTSVPIDVKITKGHEVLRRRRRDVVPFFEESSRPRVMDSA
jgi:hypothetical protein